MRIWWGSWSGGSSPASRTALRSFFHGLTTSGGITSAAGRAAPGGRGGAAGAAARSSGGTAYFPWAMPPSSRRRAWSRCSPRRASSRRPALASSAGRASRCPENRSSSTSVSLTSPSRSASHLRSSRSRSVHPGSSSSEKVRRVERIRRVATLAWCTASGSSPVRTPASCRNRRRVPAARSWRSSASTLAPASTSGSTTSGPSARPGPPRARRYLGVGSGAPAPAPPPPRPPPPLPGQAGVGRLVQLDLELAEAGHDAAPVHHLDLVVDHLGEPRPARVAQLHRAAQGAHPYRRRQLGGADERPDQGEGLGRRPAAVAGEDVLGPDEQDPVLA